MNEVVLIILAYFLGSVPTAVWVGRSLFNIDIREHGSGNAGATNTYRVLGATWGTFVLVVDMLKAVAAVKLVYFLPAAFFNDDYLIGMQIGLGLAAVLGHVYPIWAGFRGGKGVATLFGMVLGIKPLVAVSSIAFFILILFLIRMLSAYQTDIKRFFKGIEDFTYSIRKRSRRGRKSR